MNRDEWEKASGVKFTPLPLYPDVFVVFASRITSKHWAKLWVLSDYTVTGSADGCISLAKKEDQP